MHSACYKRLCNSQCEKALFTLYENKTWIFWKIWERNTWYFISSFLFDRNNFLHYRPDSTWLRILWGEEQRRVLREEQFEFVLLWVHADHHSRRHWHRGTAGSVSVSPCYIICYHTVSVSICPCYIMSYCLNVSLSMLHYVILFQCQSVHATSCYTASVLVFPRYIICRHTVSVSVSPRYIIYCHTV